MGFSVEWEQAFSAGSHYSRWPWSDLISLCKRYQHRLPARPRVLELGCGVGANVPFFLAQDWDYWAVEGSESAVTRLVAEYPVLQGKVCCADFVEMIPFSPAFDLIVDRAALTHNTEHAIQRTLRNIQALMSPGGLYIGVDWFSTKHDAFVQGVMSADEWTRTGHEHGPFQGVGQVHFSDQTHLQYLFMGWEWLALEEKVITRHLPHADTLAMWNLVVRKP